MKRFLIDFIASIILMAGMSLALTSCDKDNDKDNNGNNSVLEKTFYVAGSENSSGIAQPVVWINGIARNLGESRFGCVCNAVATGTDNSVYAGVVSDDANSYIYKDGELLFTLDKSNLICSLNSMALLGDVVYSCGYDGDPATRQYACVWRGSEKYFSLTQNSNCIKVLPVNENEIYMAVEEYNGQEIQPAIYKNGNKHYNLPSPEGINTSIKDAVYVNGDIYTVGEYSEYHDPLYIYTIIVWKNNVKLYNITGKENASCYANAIYVNRQGNIFVGGQETNEDGDLIAKIWKDGNLYYELDGGANRSNVTSITENDGLIYASGEIIDWSGAKAVIWQENAILYKMSPSGDDPVTKQLLIK